MKKVLVIGVFSLLILTLGILCFGNNNNNLDINNQSSKITVKSKNHGVSQQILEEQIFANIQIPFFEELVDFTSISDIYDFVDLVLVGTIEEKSNGTMIENQMFPYTQGKIKIEKIIKGSVDTNNLDFLIMGGTVKVKNYEEAIKNITPEKILKLGIDKLTDSEKSEKYINYNYKYGKDFEKGKKYVIMLNKTHYGYLCISNAGFIDIQNESKIDTKEDILKLNKNL